MLSEKPVIAVALSGGVDSLVSGFLLKQKYENIFGINFKTGYEKKKTNIESLEKQLGIPVKSVDFSEIFQREIVDYFVETYMKGKTPNPCLVCNKKIKFGALLKEARNSGADFLATGHYATISGPDSCHQRNTYYLEKGRDSLKDQSYFLSMLSSDQLGKIILPLSDMTKVLVKKIARENDILPLNPDESQDICFIQEKNFFEFIIQKQGLKPGKGKIVDVRGKVLGEHRGLYRFTVGQRRGINCPAVEPYYVKKIDMKNNRLVVGFKKDLTRRKFQITNINWNYHLRKTEFNNIRTKIRYSHQGSASKLQLKDYIGRVEFEEPQYAVTPGQAAVFYKGTRILGAGIIQ